VDCNSQFTTTAGTGVYTIGKKGGKS